MEETFDVILDRLNTYKDVLLLGGFGLAMLFIGMYEWKNAQATRVIELAEEDTDQVIGDVLVDISGAVNRPGVYRFEIGSRAGQAIEAALGFTDEADPDWIARDFNLASELVDGSKIYVPFEADKYQIHDGATVLGTSQSDVININRADSAALEQLAGVGSVRAQSIIDNRPYQNIVELEEKANLPKNVIEANKDRIRFF